MVHKKDIPKIGRYSVKHPLGQGGMGTVYLAKDPFIDRDVAIKSARFSQQNDSNDLKRFHQSFFNEARAAGKLLHPHIVSVFDAFTEVDVCHLVMEYVEGVTLQEYTREKGLIPFDEVVRIVFQCAKALDYAHSQGVIHRDIKPGNILLSLEGNVKISDFGIARIEGEVSKSNANHFPGSLFYTSPEVIRGEPVTGRSDLFSLGVVMYELLSGRRPFEAETSVAVLFKILNEEPQSLKDLRPEIPESLVNIVRRALEKDPDQRYERCLDLASHLNESFEQLSSSAQQICLEERYQALRKIAFFNDFKPPELAEVLNNTQWLKYDSNATVVSEGELEDSFYIIISGEVAVKKRAKTLSRLGQGDCFGEMGYLGKTKRTATIQAIKDTILMKINALSAERVSANTQLRFYRVFSKTLIQRLARASEILSN
jgi:serine/threonine protein kinase